MRENVYRDSPFPVALGNKKSELKDMKASGALANLQGAEHAVPDGVWMKTNPHQPFDSAMAGNVVTGTINIEHAAKLLVMRSHILATESEIVEFQTRTRREYSRLKTEEALQRGVSHLTIIEPQLPAVKK